jgi:SAM-dependent methyltransferase
LQVGLHDQIAWVTWAAATRLGTRPPAYGPVDPAKVGALRYSQRSLMKYTPLPRTEWLMYLAAALKDSAPSGLLIIGPRYEGEVFMARGLGWSSEQIHALDLLSYSRRVSRGDMHRMDFATESFGIVVCGWTLSYSHAPAEAAAEIARVVAPGGVVIFGVEIAGLNAPRTLDVPMGHERIQTVRQFQELFPGWTTDLSTSIGRNLIVALRRPR